MQEDKEKIDDSFKLKTRDNVEVVMIDDRELNFTLGENGFPVDIIVERSINHSRALHALRIFQSIGIKCVNTYDVATICGDKLLTSTALQEHNVPLLDN